MPERLSPRLRLIPHPRTSEEGMPERLLGNHDLPIAAHREEIEDALRNNPVTVISAPTGSGKSTQVAQYARDMLNEAGERLFPKIILTQPRIVAARTLAGRIAHEVEQAERADAVGFYTGNEWSPEPQRTRDMAVLTEGKEWRQELHRVVNPDRDVNKLVLGDEIHEWSLDTEIHVATIKARTNPTSSLYDPKYSASLMSATMDTAGLREFFGDLNPPVINVGVRTFEVAHSVSDKPIAEVALELAHKYGKKVLVFLPGKREISKLAFDIGAKQHETSYDERVPVIPLHGQQSAEVQNRAFADYPNGAIIAATNAAETSLTVPDVVAVVDSGHVRIDGMLYDIVSTGSDMLSLKLAAQANLDQRAGRAGRTEPGEYILCLTPNGKLPPVAKEDRPEYEIPAIQRSALDGMLLSLKAAGYDFGDFDFYHKPPEQAVEAARKKLFTLGATDENGDITERGKFMEALPLDPEYACMIAFAYEKNYSDAVKKNIIDIVAIMQRGGILKRAPKEQRWRGLMAKVPGTYDDVQEQDSDFLAQLEVYVKLKTDIRERDWERYDILEYAASLVEQKRTIIAGKLEFAIDEKAALVDPENREAVLTCINAGQLNQIWHLAGDKGSLAEGMGERYPIAKASVVRGLGRVATGDVFTLNLGDKTYENLQDLTAMTDARLEQAAGHLIRDVAIEGSSRFDTKAGRLKTQVDRMFGAQVLRTFERTVKVEEADTIAADRISQDYGNHAWNVFSGSKPPRILYDAETVHDAIENPESMEYGNDPITDEPLIAWMGGNGKWCRSRDVAVDSLLACQNRLDRAPQIAGQRAINDAIRTTRAKLIAYRNSPQGRADKVAVTTILNSKSDKLTWLEEARTFLYSVQGQSSESA